MRVLTSLSSGPNSLLHGDVLTTKGVKESASREALYVIKNFNVERKNFILKPVLWPHYRPIRGVR